MRSTIAFVALALAVTLAPAVRAETNAAGDDSLHKVTIEELVKLRAANKVTAVDANNEIARSRFGSIPGAIMLSSYQGYDVKELPKDHHQKLVFYCANEKCMASHAAAHKAIDAGYKDVNILPAGIMGWRDAGQPTSPSGTGA